MKDKGHPLFKLKAHNVNEEEMQKWRDHYGACK